MKLKVLADLMERSIPQKTMQFVAELGELLLGAIILAYCIIATVGSIFSIDLSQLFWDTSYLRAQLSNIYSILIGIELIMMIASPSVDSVVDVMLFAVSRQMIVEHTTPLENLLTIAAVALLFVVRKYLYISKIDSRRPPKNEQKKGPEDKSIGPSK